MPSQSGKEDKNVEANTKVSVNASKNKAYGYFHALIMLVCFAVVLGAIYTQQQPYKYTNSHISLMNALKHDQAESVSTIDDIWKWVDDVITSIGGNTVNHIKSNCRYSSPASQVVRIDNVNYDLVDPDLQMDSCDPDRFAYIPGDGDEVYLTGNHQVLSFGIFTERSTPHYPVRNSAMQQVKVRSSKIESLNPIKDDKIIQICENPPWGSFCLLKDGFVGQPGSTFGWTGQQISDKYVYEIETSWAVLFSEASPPEILYPCYGYYNSTPTDDGGDNGPPPPQGPGYTTERIVSSDEVRPGYSGYNGTIEDMNLGNCDDYTWVSRGVDIRIQCLDLYNSQPSAILSYLARKSRFTTVTELYHIYFGCDELIPWDPDQIDKTFVHAYRSLESYLPKEDAHGLFFNTVDQKTWVEDSSNGRILLQAHKFIDENTRVFRVYLLTRNLGAEDLFYSMITMEFVIRTDGVIKTSAKATHVPMIQYYYGSDGYEWRVKEVYVLEILLIIIFALFTLREVWQLYYKRLVPLGKMIMTRSNKSISPADTCEKPKLPTQEVVQLEAAENGSGTSTGNASNKIVASQEQILVRDDSSKDLGDIVDDIGEKLDEFVEDVGETLDALEDAIEDFLPDEGDMHDILDWITILVLSLAVYYRVKFIREAENLHNTFLGIDKRDEEFDSYLEDIITDFADLRSQQEASRLIAIALLVVTIMQFFRYMSFDQKLGIVTSTISSATSDLLPVLLIFFVILIAYAVLGTEIYGAELEEWSNIGKSLVSLLIMMLGEFGNYYELRDVSPVETSVFFWSFAVLMSFILLNMVLAVIFTIYDGKYQEIKSNEALQVEKAPILSSLSTIGRENEAKKDK